MAENSPIILVENDLVLAQKIGLDLTEAGYQVAIAENARTGLEHAKNYTHH
jgi:DNA-binding response OmpR family regulator